MPKTQKCRRHQNEEVLKKCMSDLHERNRRNEEKYRALKQHAEEKLAMLVQRVHCFAVVVVVVVVVD